MFGPAIQRFPLSAMLPLLTALFVMGLATNGRGEVIERSIPTCDLPVTLSAFAREFRQILADRGVSRVVVLDFVDRTPRLSSPGGALRMLAKRCGDHLSLRLAQRTERVCRIDSAERTRETLSKANLSADELAGSGNWDALKRAFPETGAFVQGSILKIDGNRAELECNLIELASGETIAKLHGTSYLDFNDWSRLGHSGFRSNFQETKDEPLYEDDLLGSLMLLSEEAHPLDAAKPLVPIHVVVDGKRRKGVFQNNDCFVPVKKGEKFAVQIQNPFAEAIHVKLLVNGHNTMTQKEINNPVETHVIMMEVPLTEARAWVLQPAERGGNAKGEYAIRGFFDPANLPSQVREFRVGAKPLDAIGGNQQWGLITAAVYQSHEKRIRQPSRYDRDYPLEYDYEIGNLIALIQIRLVDASAISEMP